VNSLNLFTVPVDDDENLSEDEENTKKHIESLTRRSFRHEMVNKKILGKFSESGNGA
jgi:hypothetical protein